MATVSPQLNVIQTILLTQADILTLYSVGKILTPPEVGYASVFAGCSLGYTYKNAPFTNVDNLIAFYLQQPDSTLIQVSNALNGINIIGIEQSTSNTFTALNPLPVSASGSDNSSLVLKMSGSDPLGGDPSSLLSARITYHILEV